VINYIIAILVTAEIYAILALGLNVTWGMAGIANLGLAGFMAVGAYATALGTKVLGLPIGFGMVLAVATSAIIGMLVSVSTLRLRGDYLAIVTLGFAEIVRLVASNETWLTNGTDGIAGIAGPWRGKLTPLEFNWLYLAMTTVLLLMAVVFCQRLARAPYGRVFRAIRDDEVLVGVAGKNTLRFKLQAVAIGAGLMGFGGAIYAHYISYISPDVFRSLISLYVFLALTVGGTGNSFGAILGSMVLIGLLEASRFVLALLPTTNAVQLAASREILIGVALLMVFRFAPEGLLPERIRSHSARQI
jgi:branched-chain amino acid transport system permease protein